MKCSACETEVEDGTAICPNCDAILDMSAFSAEPPSAEDAAQDVGPAKPRPSGAKKPVRKTTGSGKAVKKAGAGASRKSGEVVAVRRMPEAPPRLLKPDPKDQADDIDWRKMSRDAANAPRPDAGPGAPKMLSPEEFLSDTRNFVKALNLPDKLAFAGAAATVASCFLPWKETFDQGDSLGLMSLGAPVFVAAVAVLAAIVIRVRGLAPKVPVMVPWLTQFGAACFCVLWSLVFIKVAWDPTRTKSPIGNAEMWASSPSVGVVLALLFSIATVGGSLLGLKEKPAR